jgi:hypothetical protein
VASKQRPHTPSAGTLHAGARPPRQEAMRSATAVLLLLGVAVQPGDGGYVERWGGTSVEDLHREYGNIFQHGNRNAASHLWSTFLIDRAPFMPRRRFLQLAGGYCAVSGSPVTPGDSTRYRMRLPHVDGSGKVTGFMYYCCWPCVCDTQDFIRVDTKTIRTAAGRRQQYNVAVIGNPCDQPRALTKPWTDPFSKQTTSISHSAQEVRCSKSGRLKGATLSDHGYPIFSLFFSAPITMEETREYKRTNRHFEDARDFDSMCEDRAKHGYNSGMGEIFRRVAAISPVRAGQRGVFRAPRTMQGVAELVAEAERRGLDVHMPPRRGTPSSAELVALLERTQARALGQVSTKRLRTVAQRRGLAIQPVQRKAGAADRDREKAERASLIESLAAAMGGGTARGGDGAATALNTTYVRGMTVKQLKVEIVRRGLDGSACLERMCLEALLLPSAESAAAHDRQGDASSVEQSGDNNRTCDQIAAGGVDGSKKRT